MEQQPKQRQDALAKPTETVVVVHHQMKPWWCMPTPLLLEKLVAASSAGGTCEGSSKNNDADSTTTATTTTTTTTMLRAKDFFPLSVPRAPLSSTSFASSSTSSAGADNNAFNNNNNNNNKNNSSLVLAAPSCYSFTNYVITVVFDMGRSTFRACRNVQDSFRVALQLVCASIKKQPHYNPETTLIEVIMTNVPDLPLQQVQQATAAALASAGVGAAVAAPSGGAAAGSQTTGGGGAGAGAGGAKSTSGRSTAASSTATSSAAGSPAMATPSAATLPAGAASAGTSGAVAGHSGAGTIAGAGGAGGGGMATSYSQLLDDYPIGKIVALWPPTKLDHFESKCLGAVMDNVATIERQARQLLMLASANCVSIEYPEFDPIRAVATAVAVTPTGRARERASSIVVVADLSVRSRYDTPDLSSMELFFAQKRIQLTMIDIRQQTTKMILATTNDDVAAAAAIFDNNNNNKNNYNNNTRSNYQLLNDVRNRIEGNVCAGVRLRAPYLVSMLEATQNRANIFNLPELLSKANINNNKSRSRDNEEEEEDDDPLERELMRLGHVLTTFSARHATLHRADTLLSNVSASALPLEKHTHVYTFDAAKIRPEYAVMFMLHIYGIRGWVVDVESRSGSSSSSSSVLAQQQQQGTSSSSLSSQLLPHRVCLTKIVRQREGTLGLRIICDLTVNPATNVARLVRRTTMAAEPRHFQWLQQVAQHYSSNTAHLVMHTPGSRNVFVLRTAIEDVDHHMVRFLTTPDAAEAVTLSSSLLTKQRVSPLQAMSSYAGLVLPMTAACHVRTMTFVVQCDSFNKEEIEASRRKQQEEQQQQQQLHALDGPSSSTQVSPFASSILNSAAAAAAASAAQNAPANTAAAAAASTTTAAAPPVLYVHSAVHAISQIESLLLLTTHQQQQTDAAGAAGGKQGKCVWTPISKDFVLNDLEGGATTTTITTTTTGAATSASTEEKEATPAPAPAGGNVNTSSISSSSVTNMDPVFEYISFYARPQLRNEPAADRAVVFLQVFQRKDFSANNNNNVSSSNNYNNPSPYQPGGGASFATQSAAASTTAPNAPGPFPSGFVLGASAGLGGKDQSASLQQLYLHSHHHHHHHHHQNQSQQQQQQQQAPISGSYPVHLRVTMPGIFDEEVIEFATEHVRALITAQFPKSPGVSLELVRDQRVEQTIHRICASPSLHAQDHQLATRNIKASMVSEPPFLVGPITQATAHEYSFVFPDISAEVDPPLAKLIVPRLVTNLGAKILMSHLVPQTGAFVSLHKRTNRDENKKEVWFVQRQPHRSIRISILVMEFGDMSCEPVPETQKGGGGGGGAATTTTATNKNNHTPAAPSGDVRSRRKSTIGGLFPASPSLSGVGFGAAAVAAAVPSTSPTSLEGRASTGSEEPVSPSTSIASAAAAAVAVAPGSPLPTPTPRNNDIMFRTASGEFVPSVEHLGWVARHLTMAKTLTELNSIASGVWGAAPLPVSRPLPFFSTPHRQCRVDVDLVFCIPEVLRYVDLPDQQEKNANKMPESEQQREKHAGEQQQQQQQQALDASTSGAGKDEFRVRPPLLKRAWPAGLSSSAPLSSPPSALSVESIPLPADVFQLLPATALKYATKQAIVALHCALKHSAAGHWTLPVSVLPSSLTDTEAFREVVPLGGDSGGCTHVLLLCFLKSSPSSFSSSASVFASPSATTIGGEQLQQHAQSRQQQQQQQQQENTNTGSAAPLPTPADPTTSLHSHSHPHNTTSTRHHHHRHHHHHTSFAQQQHQHQQPLAVSGDYRDFALGVLPIFSTTTTTATASGATSAATAAAAAAAEDLLMSEVSKHRCLRMLLVAISPAHIFRSIVKEQCDDVIVRGWTDWNSNQAGAAGTTGAGTGAQMPSPADTVAFSPISAMSACIDKSSVGSSASASYAASPFAQFIMPPALSLAAAAASATWSRARHAWSTAAQLVHSVYTLSVFAQKDATVVPRARSVVKEALPFWERHTAVIDLDCVQACVECLLRCPAPAAQLFAGLKQHQEQQRQQQHQPERDGERRESDAATGFNAAMYDSLWNPDDFVDGAAVGEGTDTPPPCVDPVAAAAVETFAGLMVKALEQVSLSASSSSSSNAEQQPQHAVLRKFVGGPLLDFDGATGCDHRFSHGVVLRPLHQPPPPLATVTTTKGSAALPSATTTTTTTPAASPVTATAGTTDAYAAVNNNQHLFLPTVSNFSIQLVEEPQLLPESSDEQSAAGGLTAAAAAARSLLSQQLASITSHCVNGEKQNLESLTALLLKSTAHTTHREGKEPMSNNSSSSSRLQLKLFFAAPPMAHISAACNERGELVINDAMVKKLCSAATTSHHHPNHPHHPHHHHRHQTDSAHSSMSRLVSMVAAQLRHTLAKLCLDECVKRCVLPLAPTLQLPAALAEITEAKKQQQQLRRQQQQQQQREHQPSASYNDVNNDGEKQQPLFNDSSDLTTGFNDDISNENNTSSNNNDSNKLATASSSPNSPFNPTRQNTTSGLSPDDIGSGGAAVEITSQNVNLLNNSNDHVASFPHAVSQSSMSSSQHTAVPPRSPTAADPNDSSGDIAPAHSSSSPPPFVPSSSSSSSTAQCPALPWMHTADVSVALGIICALKAASSSSRPVEKPVASHTFMLPQCLCSSSSSSAIPALASASDEKQKDSSQQQQQEQQQQISTSVVLPWVAAAIAGAAGANQASSHAVDIKPLFKQASGRSRRMSTDRLFSSTTSGPPSRSLSRKVSLAPAATSSVTTPLGGVAVSGGSFSGNNTNNNMPVEVKAGSELDSRVEEMEDEERDEQQQHQRGSGCGGSAFAAARSRQSRSDSHSNVLLRSTSSLASITSFLLTNTVTHETFEAVFLTETDLWVKSNAAPVSLFVTWSAQAGGYALTLDIFAFGPDRHLAKTARSVLVPTSPSLAPSSVAYSSPSIATHAGLVSPVVSAWSPSQPQPQSQSQSQQQQQQSALLSTPAIITEAETPIMMPTTPPGSFALVGESAAQSRNPSSMGAAGSSSSSSTSSMQAQHQQQQPQLQQLFVIADTGSGGNRAHDLSRRESNTSNRSFGSINSIASNNNNSNSGSSNIVLDCARNVFLAVRTRIFAHVQRQLVARLRETRECDLMLLPADEAQALQRQRAEELAEQTKRSQLTPSPAQLSEKDREEKQQQLTKLLMQQHQQHQQQQGSTSISSGGNATTNKDATTATVSSPATATPPPPSPLSDFITSSYTCPSRSVDVKIYVEQAAANDVDTEIAEALQLRRIQRTTGWFLTSDLPIKQQRAQQQQQQQQEQQQNQNDDSLLHVAYFTPRKAAMNAGSNMSMNNSNNNSGGGGVVGADSVPRVMDSAAANLFSLSLEVFSLDGAEQIQDTTNLQIEVRTAAQNAIVAYLYQKKSMSLRQLNDVLFAEKVTEFESALAVDAGETKRLRDFLERSAAFSELKLVYTDEELVPSVAGHRLWGAPLLFCKRRHKITHTVSIELRVEARAIASGDHHAAASGDNGGVLPTEANETTATASPAESSATTTKTTKTILAQTSRENVVCVCTFYSSRDSVKRDFLFDTSNGNNNNNNSNSNENQQPASASAAAATTATSSESSWFIALVRECVINPALSELSLVQSLKRFIDVSTATAPAATVLEYPTAAAAGFAGTILDATTSATTTTTATSSIETALLQVSTWLAARTPQQVAGAADCTVTHQVHSQERFGPASLNKMLRSICKIWKQTIDSNSSGVSNNSNNNSSNSNSDAGAAAMWMAHQSAICCIKNSNTILCAVRTVPPLSAAACVYARVASDGSVRVFSLRELPLLGNVAAYLPTLQATVEQNIKAQRDENKRRQVDALKVLSLPFEVGQQQQQQQLPAPRPYLHQLSRQEVADPKLVEFAQLTAAIISEQQQQQQQQPPALHKKQSSLTKWRLLWEAILFQTATASSGSGNFISMPTVDTEILLSTTFTEESDDAAAAGAGGEEAVLLGKVASALLSRNFTVIARPKGGTSAAAAASTTTESANSNNISNTLSSSPNHHHHQLLLHRYSANVDAELICIKAEYPEPQQQHQHQQSKLPSAIFVARAHTSHINSIESLLTVKLHTLRLQSSLSSPCFSSSCFAGNRSIVATRSGHGAGGGDSSNSNSALPSPDGGYFAHLRSSLFSFVLQMRLRSVENIVRLLDENNNNSSSRLSGGLNVDSNINITSSASAAAASFLVAPSNHSSPMASAPISPTATTTAAGGTGDVFEPSPSFSDSPVVATSSNNNNNGKNGGMNISRRLHQIRMRKLAQLRQNLERCFDGGTLPVKGTLQSSCVAADNDGAGLFRVVLPEEEARHLLLTSGSDAATTAAAASTADAPQSSSPLLPHGIELLNVWTDTSFLDETGIGRSFPKMILFILREQKPVFGGRQAPVTTTTTSFTSTSTTAVSSTTTTTTSSPLLLSPPSSASVITLYGVNNAGAMQFRQPDPREVNLALLPFRYWGKLLQQGGGGTGTTNNLVTTRLIKDLHMRFTTTLHRSLAVAVTHVVGPQVLSLQSFIAVVQELARRLQFQNQQQQPQGNSAALASEAARRFLGRSTNIAFDLSQQLQELRCRLFGRKVLLVEVKQSVTPKQAKQHQSRTAPPPPSSSFAIVFIPPGTVPSHFATLYFSQKQPQQRKNKTAAAVAGDGAAAANKAPPAAAASASASSVLRHVVADGGDYEAAAPAWHLVHRHCCICRNRAAQDQQRVTSTATTITTTIQSGRATDNDDNSRLMLMDSDNNNHDNIHYYNNNTDEEEEDYSGEEQAVSSSSAAAATAAASLMTPEMEETAEAVLRFMFGAFMAFSVEGMSVKRKI